MNYKSFYVWYNDLQHKWLIQVGYEVLASYNTLQGAKSSITQKWSKD